MSCCVLCVAEQLCVVEQKWSDGVSFHINPDVPSCCALKARGNDTSNRRLYQNNRSVMREHQDLTALGMIYFGCLLPVTNRITRIRPIQNVMSICFPFIIIIYLFDLFRGTKVMPTNVSASEKRGLFSTAHLCHINPTHSKWINIVSSFWNLEGNCMSRGYNEGLNTKVNAE